MQSWKRRRKPRRGAWQSEQIATAKQAEEKGESAKSCHRPFMEARAGSGNRSLIRYIHFKAYCEPA